jgi:hypothetical protein
VSTENDMLDLGAVTPDTFSPVVGQAFEAIDEAGNAHPLTLEACEPGPDGPRPDGMRQPFSLLFRGPAAEVLPQRIYSLRNAQLGTVEMFLVPIGRDQDGTRYEVVFG